MSYKKTIIFSAPSGCGKTSLAKALITSREDVVLSVSHTTRTMREGEQDGVDYHFISQDGFKTMRAEGAFLEHAQVFDNFYGTSLQTVEQQINSGKHVILDIDWQGARQVRLIRPEIESVFIMPPTVAALEERLNSRGQDSTEIITRRMQAALSEMSHEGEYTYSVVNDNFELALQELSALLDA